MRHQQLPRLLALVLVVRVLGQLRGRTAGPGAGLRAGAGSPDRLPGGPRARERVQDRALSSLDTVDRVVCLQCELRGRHALAGAAVRGGAGPGRGLRRPGPQHRGVQHGGLPGADPVGRVVGLLRQLRGRGATRKA